MIVFDKAYNYYHQFALWTNNKVYFVTRQNWLIVFVFIKLNELIFDETIIS